MAAKGVITFLVYMGGIIVITNNEKETYELKQRLINEIGMKRTGETEVVLWY